MRYILIIFAALVAFGPASVSAQQFRVAPTIDTDTPDQPNAIPLYGKATPGSISSESWTVVQGFPIYAVRNVTMPSITPFLPDPDKATGAAVIIAPGGAFMKLSITREGTDVAEALVARGIAAFVLKYRLVPTPAKLADAQPFMDRVMRGEGSDPKRGTLLERSQAVAVEDALAALDLVRARASEWGIDPDRVGMIGFSAGAMTARRVAIDPEPERRPDFIGYIYGPQNAEPVPSDAPDMFVAIAFDDPIFRTAGFPIVQAWLDARVPVELHAFGRGRHGFGLGYPGTTTTMMLDEFVAWIDMQGFLKPKVNR